MFGSKFCFFFILHDLVVSLLIKQDMVMKCNGRI